jgi:hypothetical protein
VALTGQLAPEPIARLHEDAEDRLAALHEEVEAHNDALWIPTDGIELPSVPAIPAAALNRTPSPLASTRVEFVELIHRLKASGGYARSKR